MSETLIVALGRDHVYYFVLFWCLPSSLHSFQRQDSSKRVVPQQHVLVVVMWSSSFSLIFAARCHLERLFTNQLVSQVPADRVESVAV